MDHSQRLALRKRIQVAVAQMKERSASIPGEEPVWRPFIEQLEAFLKWTHNDRDPELEEIERITVGWMAIRELGEEGADVPVPWRPLYDEMKALQHFIMNYYDPNVVLDP